MHKEPARGTDNWLVLQVLLDNQPHHVQEIYDRTKPNARNFAIRSRISNLRDDGYKIINLRMSEQNTDSIPVPQHIISRYGEHDSEGVYLLVDETPAISKPKHEGAQALLNI